MARVDVRPGEGIARIAGRSIPIAVEGAGLRLLESPGLALRPLRFGERARLTRAFAADGPAGPVGRDPRTALAEAVLRAAADEAPVPPALALVASILALHLAGADSGAPGFAEEAGVLGRRVGWSPRELADADAAEVDALAVAYGEAEREAGAVADSDGWISLALDGPTGAARARIPDLQSLEEVRDDLAGDLLRRARAIPDLTVVPAAVPRPEASSPAPGSGEGRGRPAAGAVGLTAPGGPGVVNGIRALASPGRVAVGGGASGREREPVHSSGRRSAPSDAPLGETAGAAAADLRHPAEVRPPRRSTAMAAAWTPAPSGPGDQPLAREALAAVYPGIFGPGGEGWPGGGTSRGPRVVGEGRDRGGPAGGLPAAWPGHGSAGVGPPPARPAAVLERTGAPGNGAAATRRLNEPGASEPDVDAVARALHRAADLRGLAP